MKKSKANSIAKSGLAVLAIIGAIGFFGAQANTPDTTRTYSAPTSSQNTLSDTEVTPVPETKAPAVTPPPTYTPSAQSTCNPNYSGCVPNSSSDLDCVDIGEQVRVIGNDEYRLDRDNDGYGCESY